MKKKKVIKLHLTYEDVYRLYSLVAYNHNCNRSDDDELFEKMNILYQACIDDIPISMLYPGAISYILDEMSDSDAYAYSF